MDSSALQGQTTSNSFSQEVELEGGYTTVNRGSYMSAHVLLNLLNKFEEKDKMQGFVAHLTGFPQ